MQNVWFGNVEKALSSELARIAAEREGLSEELDGARATLARIAGEQDRLVNEGSSLWNDVVEITGELARVASEHDDAAREIDGVRASLADVARERDGLARREVVVAEECRPASRQAGKGGV